MSYLDPVGSLPFDFDNALGIPTPLPMKPTLPGPSPFLGMSGQTADNVATGLLGTLQGLQPINPRLGQGEQFAQALLRSAMGAWASPRVAAAQARKDESTKLHEANLKATEEHRNRLYQAGRDLRSERSRLAEIKAQAEAQASLRTPPKTPEQIRADSEAELLGQYDAKRKSGVPLVAQDRSEDGPGTGLTWKQISAMNALNNQINSNTDVKEFVLRRQGYDQVIAGSRENSAAGDLSVIYGYIRLQDPNAVREGEIRNVEQAQSYLRRYMNLPTKWRTGERLNPEFRKELASSATALYRSQLPNYRRRMDQFKAREIAMGLPPGLVTGDYESAEPEAGDNPGRSWFDANKPPGAAK